MGAFSARWFLISQIVTFHGRNNALNAFEKDSSIIRKIAKLYYRLRGYLFNPSKYVIDGNYTIPNYGGALVKLSWIASLIHDNEDIRIISIAKPH